MLAIVTFQFTGAVKPGGQASVNTPFLAGIFVSREAELSPLVPLFLAMHRI
jgi:hypothetical protein